MFCVMTNDALPLFPPLAEADFHCVHAFLRHERQVVAVNFCI